MELSIIRRETTGSPPNQYNESETITKFEIMDGAPIRGRPPRPLLLCAHILTAVLSPPRRDDPHPTLPRGLRPDADVPRREQEVQHAILPQPRPHRRGEQAVLQAAGDHVLPDTRSALPSFLLAVCIYGDAHAFIQN